MAAWRLVVGPPAAELAVGVIDPADFRVMSDVTETDDTAGRHTININVNWQYPDKATKPPEFAGPPKGTLVFLPES